MRIVTVLLQLLEQGQNVLLCILIKMCMLKKIYICGKRLNLVIVTKKCIYSEEFYFSLAETKIKEKLL